MTDHLRTIIREGYGIRLVPMNEGHAHLCVGQIDPALFRYFTIGGPREDSLLGWSNFLRAIYAADAVAAYAIIDPTTDQILGGTSYMEIRPAQRTIEVGFSWIRPEFQRTHVNPAAKYLMLTTAFDEYEMNRVQLKCDNRNEQSKANILKLGAKFEGVLRQHIIMVDGFIRDTAMFSIIRAEWPDVRAGLLNRLPHLP